MYQKQHICHIAEIKQVVMPLLDAVQGPAQGEQHKCLCCVDAVECCWAPAKPICTQPAAMKPSPLHEQKLQCNHAADFSCCVLIAYIASTVPATNASLSRNSIFLGVTCFFTIALSLALLIRLVSTSPTSSCSKWQKNAICELIQKQQHKLFPPAGKHPDHPS